MADGEKLLTDEEMQAIEEVVASGGLEEGGYNVGAAAEQFALRKSVTRLRTILIAPYPAKRSHHRPSNRLVSPVTWAIHQH